MPGGAGPRGGGSAWRRDIVAYLKGHGFPYAERAFGAGRPEDVGDIDGLPGFVIEAKAHRSLDLAGWADEAEMNTSTLDNPSPSSSPRGGTSRLVPPTR